MPPSEMNPSARVGESTSRTQIIDELQDYAPVVSAPVKAKVHARFGLCSLPPARYSAEAFTSHWLK